MARPITDTLRGIAAGELVQEAGEQLRELVNQVSITEKGGSVAIKISVKPAGRASGAMEVSYEVKTTMPKMTRRSSVMWGTPEGDLLTSDPSQAELDLKSVNTGPAKDLKSDHTTSQTRELKQA